ncbi:hypothetical protein LTR74_004042 [Friedmanniomyces endolithicus]|nr:hypothetical protein LTR74_004042 [Friedmanniomyces endolithicus]
MDVLGSAIAIAPMDRAGTAQEVADCVLFLASSKATFVQGSALVVDGGTLLEWNPRPVSHVIGEPDLAYAFLKTAE